MVIRGPSDATYDKSVFMCESLSKHCFQRSESSPIAGRDSLVWKCPHLCQGISSLAIKQGLDWECLLSNLCCFDAFFLPGSLPDSLSACLLTTRSSFLHRTKYTSWNMLCQVFILSHLLFLLNENVFQII